MTDSLHLRGVLPGRLREARLALYGEHGGPMLAQALRISWRAWQNYELGVDIPGFILLEFLAQTRVRVEWLRTGEGPMTRS
jgi:hypothetical protein